MQTSGILAINKPIGLSTYDLIRVFKKNSNFKGKVGHAGTLDVFASGLVLILVGQSTKDFLKWQTFNKQYLASTRLNYSTNTLDIEGKIKEINSLTKLKTIQIEKNFPNFIGKIKQKIPNFSAAKYHGRPLYKLALKGQLINRKKEIYVKEIKLIAHKSALVTLKITCSSGTYIRQLVYDFFKTLGISSFLFSLVRTQIGPISLQKANNLEILTTEEWKKYLIKP